jgi:integrase
MPLNQLKCQKAKPAAKPFKLADGNGLYLEVMPGGSKLWRLKYRFLGKENRLSMGAFPEVSLLEARDKRDQARKLLQAGIDPSMARKRERQQAILSAALTFELVAREWHENQSQIWTAQYSGSVMRRLELDVFPYIGRLPMADLNAPTLLAVLRRVEARGAHEIAHRLLQTCGQICRYAIVTGRAERNPAADLRGALRAAPHGHYAALQAKELPEFVRTLEQNDARLFLHTRLAIKLLMLTFVRTGELIGATWDEIDLEARQWVIPAARMKIRKAHIIPLSLQAVAILRQLKEHGMAQGYVFPSQINSRKHMSNNTILKALERLGYKGRMTGHGFRALAMSTIKEKLGYRHEVVDRQLAHAPRSKVDAAYDRAEFLDDRRRMMQEWANYIDAQMGAGIIIPLKAKEA